MDVTSISARLVFDCAHRTARAEALVRFTVEDGPALFDLRQRIESARLDGQPVDPATLAPRSDGIREIDLPLDPGDHELEVAYAVGTPSCSEALPLGWTLQRPGIMFDFWMSDLHPGRYLEMWFPSPLCHDQFRLTLDVQIIGAGPHRVFANGLVESEGDGQHRVTYPAHYTSLSPMLVISPDERYDLLVTTEDGLTIETLKLGGPEIDLAACHVTVTECLAHNGKRFGAYGHGDRFLTYLWGSSRGMEYDGATTASVESLEHEVLHSWFGRGVKPASASDGWIDEAFTTWYTAAPPRPRQWAQAFDRTEPPALLCPRSPLARYTPREAYSVGARFFAGIAHLVGVDRLCDTMGSLYRERVGGFLSTKELEERLASVAGRDLSRPFARWVHGIEDHS